MEQKHEPMNKDRIEKRESSSAKTFWIFKTACFNRSHIPPRETSGYLWLFYPTRSRDMDQSLPRSRAAISASACFSACCGSRPVIS